MSEDRLLRLLADLRPQSAAVCEVAREARQQIMMLREVAAQLEANVAEARAEVERTNHIMRLERMARQDSEDRLKAQLAAAEAAMSNRDGDWVLALGHAAGLNSGLMVPIVPKVGPCRELLDGYAEAAREAVLASLAAAEAVAGEVREACVRSLNGMQRLYLGSNHVFVAKVLSDAKNAIHSVPLPTPSAALQRVREQEAERALRWAADHPCGTGGLADLLGAVADDPRDQWAGYVKRGLAALFPTTDAGGPA